jgi:hypothetical protein
MSGFDPEILCDICGGHNGAGIIFVITIPPVFNTYLTVNATLIGRKGV